MNNIFDRVSKIQKICWDVNENSEEYLQNPIHYPQIYLLRKISIWITYFIKDTRITPNQVTAAMVGIMTLGCSLFIFRSYYLSLLGIGLIFLSYVLDNVDGELARYKKNYSYTGINLDLLYHHMLSSLVFAGLTIGFVLHEPTNTPVIVLGILATALAVPLSRMQQSALLLIALTVIKPSNKPDDARLKTLAEKKDAVFSSPKPSKSTIEYLPTVVFTDIVVLSFLMLAILFDGTEWYLAFYGIAIPMSLIPKFLARNNELYKTLSSQRSIDHFFEGSWNNFV